MMKHGMHGILNMFQTNFFPETEKRIFIGLSSSIYKNSWIYGKRLRFALKKVSRFLFRSNIKIKDFFFQMKFWNLFFVILAAMQGNYLSNMPEWNFPCTSILTFEICLRKMAKIVFGTTPLIELWNSQSKGKIGTFRFDILQIIGA